MNVFITGADGFVGVPTIKELTLRKHRLLALVRGKDRMSRLSGLGNVETVIGDFSDIAKYRAALRKFQPDGAIHLAWEGIPDDSQKIALKNVAGSILLFEELRASGVKKVISIGSCREYGDPRGKINESSSISSPYNMLYAAKAHLHRLAAEFFKKSGVDFIWARPFYIYGPGQRPGSLIPSTIRAFKSNKNPEIKDKHAAHDFIFVDDVARAIVDILEKHRNYHSGVYNVGTGRLTNVGEVVAMVYGRGVSVAATERKKGFFADLSLIKKEIGWRPQVSVAKGIKATLDFY